MIVLATTSDVLRLVTSTAAALDVHATFVDNAAASYTPGRQNTTITTVTTTTVVSAPAASNMQRGVKHVSAHARGGVNTVTVEYFDGANAFRLESVALGDGETLEYEDAHGWRVLTAAGEVKGVGPAGPAGPTGATGAGTDLGWFVVGAFTAAAIQDAIDDCYVAGGGTVYFPAGDYDISTALQDTGRSNAQILLPRVMVDATTQPITIRLLGPIRPTAQPSVVGAIALPTSGAIIRSSLGGSGGALLGAWGPSGSYENFSYCRVEIQNLTFRMPANPTRSALDLSHCTACSLDGVCVDASNYDIASIAAQSTASSFGLRLPANNNGASVEIPGRIDVIGFYNGIEIGEHTRADHVAVWGCTNGVVLPLVYHASIIDRLMVVHSKNGMYFSGAAEHSVRINQLNIEHAPSGTWAPVADIADPNNRARGSAMWHVVLAGSGINNTLLVDGGRYMKRTHIDYDGQVFQLTDAATVTIDCSLSDSFRWTLAGNRTFANPANPYDGQVLNVRVLQDATGGRTWTLGSKFKFAGGAPLLSVAANAKDFLSMQYDANQDTWNCALSKAMA